MIKYFTSVCGTIAAEFPFQANLESLVIKVAVQIAGYAVTLVVPARLATEYYLVHVSFAVRTLIALP